MPTLQNTRHEKFALELAAGKSATEAYVLAGYRPSRRNASRLRTSEDVIGRVKELQAASANHAVITVASICAELDQAIQVAVKGNQAAAMVSASALKAKLAGLMVERVEVSNADPFVGAATYEEVAAIWARLIAKEKNYQMTPEELDKFTMLVRQCHEAIDEFIAGCTAKVVPRTLTPQEAADIERKRLRLGNGSVRPR